MILKELVEKRRKELDTQLQAAFMNLETAKSRVSALQGALALCDEFLASADKVSTDGNNVVDIARV